MVTDRLAELLDPWLTEGPAYHAVAAGIRGLALDGRLALGTRVPSERSLAAALRLSRTTVTAAYDVLRAEGYLVSAGGAGSRVTLPASAPVRPDADPGEPAVVRDLTVAATPAPAQLVDAVAQAAADLRPLLAGHGLHPYGLPALRTAVAAHLTRRGLPTVAEQVMVTNGALAGWDLLLRTVTRPGQRALVEQPTYPAALDAVAAAHLRPVRLPVTAEGWEQPAGGADVALLTPDGQNPTGLLADDRQRRALLAAVDAPVVAADETFTDLVLDGVPATPLAALDGRVVTLGSMSKAFWSGLRVGWVRADPPLLARLAQARGTVDLSSPVLEQLVAVRLLAVADEVLADRIGWLTAARDALLAALADQLPDWRVTRPQAGAMLWVQLPGGSSTRLAGHALDLGLRITPGPRFTVDGTADRWLRLPLSVPPETVGEVVGVLREAWSRTAAGAVSGRTAPRWTA
ncbi:PLP-dependent aminotransferase family protein [Modestobacter sp. L9-4]|uniref:MocR-like transcription factor YczR n=1 Tax=Modestobacter sp. L9-4 TaxID=2851567 RepID=UPI001C795196|nr:PLP-dependent aminotransferase family protein [Modestobacter sp. L9-4]QXG75430.1 PLP-dependent aminotransferase family protein [Modestobacter sp. L9-4]